MGGGVNGEKVLFWYCKFGENYIYWVSNMDDKKVSDQFSSSEQAQPVVDGVQAVEGFETEIDNMNLDNVERGEGDELSLAAVEGLIRNKLMKIDEFKEQATQLKEMVESVLENDEEYLQASEKAKEAAKAKTAAKTKVMNQPEARTAAEKLKEVQELLKDANEGLSANLREYERLSGTNQIEIEA